MLNTQTVAMQESSQEMIDRIQAELDALDTSHIEIDGKKLRPSQCYRFNLSPAHVLFNTNCPDSLRQKVEDILNKYLPDESRSQ